jgi:hypothetical protein
MRTDHAGTARIESDSDYFFYYNNNPVFEDGDATPLDADVPITVAHIESVARCAPASCIRTATDPRRLKRERRRATRTPRKCGCCSRFTHSLSPHAEP